MKKTAGFFMHTDPTCEPVFEEVAIPDRKKAEAFMAEFVKRPFDLRTAPPHRVAVIHLKPEHYLFVFVFPPTSSPTGRRSNPCSPSGPEPTTTSLRVGKASAIPADSYVDYMEAEQAFLKKNDAEADLGFWEELIGDQPLSVAVPTFADNPQGDFQALYFELDPTLADKAKSFARKEKSTFFWAFSAAWMAPPQPLQQSGADCRQLSGQSAPGPGFPTFSGLSSTTCH